MRPITSSALLRFLVFLVSPEDSRPCREQSPYRDWHNNRLAGAVKILFWIMAVILFWTSFPALCTALKTCL
jgi:hypothetical protein